MTRLSITLNEAVEDQLRQLQGEMISTYKKDISFTTVVNTVLVAGLLGSESFSDEVTKEVYHFFKTQQINMDKEGLTDNFLNMLK